MSAPDEETLAESSAEAGGEFVDIHCHLLPGIDDGAGSWQESLAMARMAVGDGIGTIVVTPHQLGNYSHNGGDEIRRRTSELQRFLDRHLVSLEVLPGGDVRIESDLADKLRSGEVLTLADQGRHVLLELPHELYFPLEPILDELAAAGMVGILSHPERNQGLLQQRKIVGRLVDQGCLMQVTAGSLLGTFGPASREFSEELLAQGLVHFLATDAHSPRARRPLIRRAFERAAELTDAETAHDLCRRYPRAVARGEDVPAGRRSVRRTRTRWRLWSRAA